MRDRGFSLIELLVVVGVLAILTVWAVPNFSGLISSTRVTTTTNEIISALASARSLAITKGHGGATLCGSDGPDDCDGSGEWNNGMMLFADGNSNGMREPTERIMQVWEPMKVPVTLAANALSLTYLPDGSISAASPVLFLVCDTTGKAPPRAVRVWGSGGHSVHTPTTCALP